MIDHDIPSEMAAMGGTPVTVKSGIPGTTRIDVTVHERTRVSVELYNARGVRVETLENKMHDKGLFSLTFHKGRNAAGICISKVTLGTISYFNCCRFF